MKAFIWSSTAGTFGIADGKVQVFIQFPADPLVLAKRLAALNKNETVEEEIKAAEALAKKGCRTILSLKAINHTGANTVKVSAEEIYGMLFSSQAAFKMAYGANETTSLACIEAARSMLKEERREKLIIQALGMYEDTVKIINVFHERLREWFLLYNQESPKSVTNEQLVSLILSGEAENAGMEFDSSDIEALSTTAGMAAELSRQKKQLEGYLDSLVKSEAANLHAVCGFLLAAKLIALSGGVEKLARAPASRIQLLGAEKALFRHMRDNTRSPKHGVILMHPIVHSSPKELKGRMSRLLAAKISLAAKIDHFSHTDRGRELRSGLDKEAAVILKTIDSRKG